MKLPELRHVLANCPKARSAQHPRSLQGQVRRGQQVRLTQPALMRSECGDNSRRCPPRRPPQAAPRRARRAGHALGVDGKREPPAEGRKWQKIGREEQDRLRFAGPHRDGASPRAGSSRKTTQGVRGGRLCRLASSRVLVPPVPCPLPGRNGRHDAHENRPTPLHTKGGRRFRGRHARHHLSSLETAREPEPREAATATTRFLQTGTGTVQTTAISTVAITAVIFSLVDRFMASSRKRGRASRPASTGACTPPGCFML